ncbi:ABC transporter substrate-binding protein [Devosia pacifica]|uniref:ABC transporter substrate-binding protein n=1 Tax=Devosia pacifica TaxID=1335967 RepID=A0A918VY22_9HYPH|nr:ABC transporter substrate-binding protein [Devosia pacifica]GHA35667.1 ABC transporter substrate-binding protein [Devosia pacifica]
MTRFPLTRRALLASTAAILATFAVSPTFAQPDSTVTAALVAEPTSLNPIYDTGLPALNVFYNVFDQLTGIDETGAVVPRLASDWSHSDDLKTWTFTLRDGATFHDGSPVTVDDVLFTYETAMNDPTSRLGGYLSTVDDITADGSDIVFTLNIPYAPFDRQATLVPIVSKSAYEQMGAEDYARKPVGSGPYMVESWVNGDTITLKRYDAYWGDAGEYETVVFQPVPDETTRANSVQSGDLDIALLGPSSVPAVEGSGSAEVIDQQSNRVVYLGYNATSAWLDDPEFRKAIDMALDRQLLSDRLLNSAVEPASQLVAKVSFGYTPDIAPTSYDPDAAKSLVEASGYDGASIPLTYPNSGLPQVDQVAQAVAFFLSEVGVNVTLDPQEASTFSNTWFSGGLSGLYIFAFAPSVMDADLPFNMLLRTGGQGYANNADIDALLDKEIGEADADARAATLAEISSIVTAETYYSPLFIDTYSYAVTPGLDWTPRPDGMIVFN